MEPPAPSSGQHPSAGRHVARLVGLALGILAGFALVVGPAAEPTLRHAGFTAIGPLLGILFIVFSLFGDLPWWIAWTQRLGMWLVPGIVLGTIWILVPLFTNPFAPAAAHESSFEAFSPRVWAAYISIVLVSISFERSTFPARIYDICRARFASPALVVPLYIVVAGLAGNLLDGVTIIAVSSVIFLKLLDREWALSASFALLFGGLISNLITVAAEPTNIKFQDVLYPVLDRVTPAYWLTNWPICVLGIGLPAVGLVWLMLRKGAQWRAEEAATDAQETDLVADRRVGPLELVLSTLAIAMLAGGIILHSMTEAHARFLPAAVVNAAAVGLWIFLLPAGVLAVAHLLERGMRRDTQRRILREVPIWIRLATIFSLLWFLGNGIPAGANALLTFFQWPEQLRFGLMTILALGSSITDNVALAAMQASLILNHPIPVWQIRLLFILLTWSGGFTPFGCLQSLALNGRLGLSSGAWLRATGRWALLAIVGGLAGLALILLWFPSEWSVPH